MKRLLLFGIIALGSFLSSCSDNVDDSNLYSFSGETISTYIGHREDCNDFAYMLSRVRTSNKSKSTLNELLSARGNYTVFVPTNEAVQHYVDSITGTPNIAMENVHDTICDEIVKTCIIDNNDDAAYQTSDFQTEGSLNRMNMNNRYITIGFDTLPGSKNVAYIINGNAIITEADHELENGYVHILNNVPSNASSTLASLLQTIPNMRIFSRLLQETGWAEQMTKYIDEDYENNHKESGLDSHGTVYQSPEHRKYGYTAFVEPDSIYEKDWGVPQPQVDHNGNITNWDDILSVVREQCSKMDIYNTTSSEDLTDEDNAVNQFVAYHLLPMSITYDKLVIHFCELNFSYTNMSKLTLNMDELYTTMGKHRRLMKITEGAQTNGKYINRYSKYDPVSYDELTVFDAGTKISGFNGNEINNSLNGFYYPINRILVYSSDTRDKVLNQRLRFDVPSFLPEIMSTGFRRPNYSVSHYLPDNFFDTDEITRTDETEMIYKATFKSEWQDYNGDEMQALGQYDFTFLLPPVPFDGTYELRIGLSNTGDRGMAQVYFGENKNNLAAVGLPLDMRLSPDNPQVGWEKDGDDETANRENDKVLRNHGYLKAPKIYGMPSATGVTTPMRDFNSWGQLKARKILYTGDFKAGKKYYCRFKSLLDNTKAQFFFDYIELVPKSVYANSETEEDVW